MGDEYKRGRSYGYGPSKKQVDAARKKETIKFLDKKRKKARGR